MKLERWITTAALALSCLAACRAPEGQSPAASSAPDRTELSGISRSTVTLQVLFEGLWGEQTSTREGGGSGFVVQTPDGPVVVTAAHVVLGATEIEIIDADGHRARATELVALDTTADVAALRIDGDLRALAPIPLADPPAVGEEVMLVSSPLGLSTTVAFGTVSAHRPEADALQLAAAVSPGSSGGLVADRRGRAVAVIRAKASMKLGGENITLVTPIERVSRLVQKRSSQPLTARPDHSAMVEFATRQLLTTRGDDENYAGSASVVVPAGLDGTVQHMCARASDPQAAVAIRELGEPDPAAWRGGVGRSCASIAGARPVEVWVGTKAVGRKIELSIQRQE